MVKGQPPPRPQEWDRSEANHLPPPPGWERSEANHPPTPMAGQVRGQSPPPLLPSRNTVNGRAVRILLECNLVQYIFILSRVQTECQH